MPTTGTGRRSLLAGLAATAFVPSAVFAQETPPQVQPEAAPGQGGALAAATDDARHLMVKVMINGKGPYSFVVDTGSERTAIADNVASELDLVHGAFVQVDGLARRIAAATVAVNEFAFGPFTRRNLRMPVLPREFLSADGYLGLDVIDGSRVVFDFRKHELRIEHSHFDGFTTPRMDVAKVQVYGPSGRLRASGCTIDGVMASAFIDSGAEVSVGNPALHAALLRRNPALADFGPLPLTGVTGGEITGRLIPVKKIAVQDLNFTDCTLVIADVPNFGTWSLEREPAVLIGMDFMRQFASVAIDYRNKEIRFDLAGITPPLSNRRV